MTPTRTSVVTFVSGVIVGAAFVICFIIILYTATSSKKDEGSVHEMSTNPTTEVTFSNRSTGTETSAPIVGSTSSSQSDTSKTSSVTSSSYIDTGSTTTSVAQTTATMATGATTTATNTTTAAKTGALTTATTTTTKSTIPQSTAQSSTSLETSATTTESPSQITTDTLSQLNQTLDPSNTYEVLKNVSKAISDHQLRPVDVSYVGDILLKAGTDPGDEPDVFHEFMQVADLTMNQTNHTLHQAQHNTNATTKILISMDHLVDNLNTTNITHAHRFNYTGKYIDVVMFLGCHNVSGVAKQQNMNGAVPISDGGHISLDTDNTEAYIKLDRDVICAKKSEIRYSFKFVRKLAMYGDPHNGTGKCHNTSNSDSTVASSHVTGDKFGDTTSSYVLMGFRKLHLNHNVTIRKAYECGYWNPDSNTWLNNGCKKMDEDSSFVRCSCNHLTDFALLLRTQGLDSIVCNSNLSWLGFVASIVSATCMAGIIAITSIAYLRTSCCSKGVPRPATGGAYVNPEFFQLTSFFVVLFLFYFSFALLSNQNLLNLTDSACKRAAAELHCLVLATFLLAFFRGIHYYRRYVVVFRRQKSILNIPAFGRITTVIGTVVPIIIVVVLYFEKRDIYSRGDGVCWLQPEYILLAVVAPILLLLTINLLLTAAIIRSVMIGHRHARTDHRLRSNSSESRKLLASMILTVVMVQVLLQLPWLLQYFLVAPDCGDSLDYVFTVFVGFQGLWLTLLHLLMFCVDRFCGSTDSVSTPTDEESSRKRDHRTSTHRPKRVTRRRSPKETYAQLSELIVPQRFTRGKICLKSLDDLEGYKGYFRLASSKGSLTTPSTDSERRGTETSKESKGTTRRYGEPAISYLGYSRRSIPKRVSGDRNRP